jgi:hypothetical protein
LRAEERNMDRMGGAPKTKSMDGDSALIRRSARRAKKGRTEREPVTTPLRLFCCELSKT